MATVMNCIDQDPGRDLSVSMAAKPTLEQLARCMRDIHRHGTEASKVVTRFLESPTPHSTLFGQSRPYSDQYIGAAQEAAYFYHAWQPYFHENGTPRQDGTSMSAQDDLTILCVLQEETPRLVKAMVYGFQNPASWSFQEMLRKDPRSGYLIIAEDIVQLQEFAAYDPLTKHAHMAEVKSYMTQALQHVGIATALGIEDELLAALNTTAKTYHTTTPIHRDNQVMLLFSALLGRVQRGLSASAAALL